MTGKTRSFRSKESLAEERITRDAVSGFLESRGLQVLADEQKKTGTALSQSVTMKSPQGETIKARVRVCWRPRGVGDYKYAAAQLRARLVEGDWDKTLRAVANGLEADGDTHLLVVHRAGPDFTHAALIPRGELAAIWRKQRDVSADLIKRGALGHRRKNHAQNGPSPTIWLHDGRDDSARAVTNVLWGWSGVLDLARLPTTGPRAEVDDTFDDCPGLPLSQIGSDGAPKVQVVRSQVRRDPRVRQEVLRRAKGQCERDGCGLERSYAGFLDVHHVLGAEKGDRVWNCVALCPNCHRDAHAAPNEAAINEALLAHASNFKDASR